MFNFGEHLKEMRVSLKYTQKYVANQIGITERNYQRYEANEQLPSFNVLIKLADFFNISLDYLVGRNNKNDHF